MPHIPAHGAWVKKYIDNGTFLLAGPKKSGLGGVILVKSIPKAVLNVLLAEDSYVQAEVVDYQIIDITAKLVPEHLSSLLDA
jgi:uncharacterized protein YciI